MSDISIVFLEIFAGLMAALITWTVIVIKYWDE